MRSSGPLATRKIVSKGCRIASRARIDFELWHMLGAWHAIRARQPGSLPCVFLCSVRILHWDRFCSREHRRRLTRRILRMGRRTRAAQCLESILALACHQPFQLVAMLDERNGMVLAPHA